MKVIMSDEEWMDRSRPRAARRFRNRCGQSFPGEAEIDGSRHLLRNSVKSDAADPKLQRSGGNRV